MSPLNSAIDEVLEVLTSKLVKNAAPSVTFKENNFIKGKLDYKQYLIWDYNSCFVIFKITILIKDEIIERCNLSLCSTDDGEFIIDFDYKHIDKVKSFFKNNYKQLTLEKIETYINNLI